MESRGRSPSLAASRGGGGEVLDRLLHDTTLAIAAGGFAAEMLNNFRWAPVPAPRLQPMVAALL